MICSGIIEKGPKADGGDSTDGNNADGYVVNGGADGWDFSNAIIGLQAWGNGTITFDFTLNNHRVDNTRLELNCSGAETVSSYYEVQLHHNINDGDNLEGNDSYDGAFASGTLFNGRDYYDVGFGNEFDFVHMNPREATVTLNRVG